MSYLVELVATNARLLLIWQRIWINIEMANQSIALHTYSISIDTLSIIQPINKPRNETNLWISMRINGTV